MKIVNIKNNNEKGFSLLEIVISIGLIAGLLVLYSAILNNVMLAQSVKRKDVALKIATHEIEGLRALGYSNLPATGSFLNDDLDSLPSGSGAIVVSDYNEDTKEVTVTVSWTEPSGIGQSVVLSTLILESGGIQ